MVDRHKGKSTSTKVAHEFLPTKAMPTQSLPTNCHTTFRVYGAQDQHSFRGYVSTYFSVMSESIGVNSQGTLGERFALLSNPPCSGCNCASARSSLGEIWRF